MAAADHLQWFRSLPLCIPGVLREAWRSTAFARLDRVLREAPTLEVDDRSRIVLLSDAHRGDNSRADAFRHNDGLFLQALSHYDAAGYTYVEVGDGDELWQNRHLSAIRRAHSGIFDLLHRLDAEERLHMLLGNHDIQAGRQRHRMVKDGLPVGEALLLRSAGSGQRLLVLHGHQVDCTADQLQVFSRLVVRRVWRRILVAGLREVHPQASRTPGDGGTHPWRLVMQWLRAEFVQRVVEWMERASVGVICGHTHQPHMPQPGASPYFNTGNCVTPGRVTGIEIRSGEIYQVRWTMSGTHAVRTVLAAPVPLLQFA